MKIITQVLFFLLIAQAGYASKDSIGCSLFKNGKFAYRNPASDAIVIIRKANRQQEYNKTQDIVTKFKVRWISSCSYELTQTWSNSKKQRRQNKAVTTVIITAVSKDEYQYTCACKDAADRRKNTGIAYRIH
jgi:translation initiation factor 2 alpha subunit (eIF-2alpha)